jgi:hypothetical protein
LGVIALYALVAFRVAVRLFGEEWHQLIPSDTA